MSDRQPARHASLIAAVLATILLMPGVSRAAPQERADATLIGRFSSLVTFMGRIGTAETFANASLIVAEGDLILARAAGVVPIGVEPRSAVAVLVMCRSACAMTMPAVESFSFESGRAVVRATDVSGEPIELTLMPEDDPSGGTICSADVRKRGTPTTSAPASAHGWTRQGRCGMPGWTEPSARPRRTSPSPRA